MKHHLIITADDYGMCEPVNTAIDACLTARAVRATCVMVNMPYCDTATTLRQRFPEASIGVHWTLTQGQPVLPVDQVSSLVGADGQFLPFKQLRHRLLFQQVDFAHVRAELIAQHHRFTDLAGAPDFWNTHEGVHVFPGFFQRFVALGRELGTTAMRCHRRLTVPYQGTVQRYQLQHPLYWLKSRIVARWAARAEAQGVMMPDGIITSLGFDEGPSAIEAIVRRMRWSGVRQAAELTIHPATTIQPELFGSMTTSRLHEYQVFSDPDLRQRLRQVGVETVGFETLSHDRTSTQTSTQSTRAV